MRDELAAIIANYVGGKTKAADEKRAEMLEEVMALVESIEPMDVVDPDASVRSTERIDFGRVRLDVDGTGQAVAVHFDNGWKLDEYIYAAG